MMRLLFLCLLLLVPATTAASDDIEGSADGVDDEDLIKDPDFRADHNSGLGVAGSTGEVEVAERFTLVVVIVAVSALVLSIGAIVIIMLVRRHMHRQQQGVYSVPIEQHHKGV